MKDFEKIMCSHEYALEVRTESAMTAFYQCNDCKEEIYFFDYEQLKKIGVKGKDKEKTYMFNQQQLEYLKLDINKIKGVKK